MKCVRIRETGAVVRVPNDDAANAVAVGKCVYTTREAWRKNGRQYGWKNKRARPAHKTTVRTMKGDA